MKSLSFSSLLPFSPPYAFAYFGRAALKKTRILASPKVMDAELALAAKGFALHNVRTFDSDKIDGSFAFQLKYKKLGSKEIQILEGRASRGPTDSIDVQYVRDLHRV